MNQQKTLILDNGAAFEINVGDILRHADWDKITDDERYLNKHLYRVTGFAVLPKDNSEAVMLKQIFHPMREYMFKVSQLTTKLDAAKYPQAQQEYLFIRHDVQFQSAAEIEILENIPKDMISYIRFQEDPLRSEHFKSYFKK